MLRRSAHEVDVGVPRVCASVAKVENLAEPTANGYLWRNNAARKHSAAFGYFLIGPNNPDFSNQVKGLEGSRRTRRHTAHSESPGPCIVTGGSDARTAEVVCCSDV